jgi:tetraacyldisaccharide 4'-kinase
MTSLLAPFALLYSSLMRVKNARMDRKTAQHLRWPVVSVGNLSVGGTGKTPLVICLAKALGREGFAVDVLSRGYGRSQRTVERVEVTGNAERFGDEPLLIAQQAGVPVYVGARRYEAGRMAEAAGGSEGRHVHLLDDGFQHRQLARTVDIVLVHRSDLHQRLLPAGRLREPLSSLSRADVIVLRQEDADLKETLSPYVRPGCCFWRVRRSLELGNGARRVVAFCAIARPGEFFAQLAATGIELAEQMPFRDHHRYTVADIDHLAELGERVGCDAFVITAKDEVKLTAAMRARLIAVAPLLTAALRVEIADEPVAVAQLLSLMDMRKSPIVTAK